MNTPPVKDKECCTGRFNSSPVAMIIPLTKPAPTQTVPPEGLKHSSVVERDELYRPHFAVAQKPGIHVAQIHSALFERHNAE